MLIIVLNERERTVFLGIMTADAGPTSEIASNFSWRQCRAVFTDWMTYAYSFLALCDIVGIYSVSMFLPSIIHGMGFSALEAQAMSSPPYVIGN